MPDPEKLRSHAVSFITQSKAQWENLVQLGAELTPRQLERASDTLAKQTGAGKKTIKRKLQAIQHEIANGFTTDALVARGQEAVLRAYVNGKVKARSEPLVAFPHRLTPGVRDALDETCRRIATVLKLKTWDCVFEFMVASFADLSDEEIEHLAGGEVPK